MRWLAVVVVVVAVCGWLVVRSLEAPPARAEPPVTQLRPVEPAQRPAPEVSARAQEVVDAAVPSPVDAGVAAGPHEVRFVFPRSAQVQRLTLRKDASEVSGNVGLMGEVDLPMTDGVWEVRAPAHTVPREVVITPETTTVNLELAQERRVLVKVLDEGEPAANVLVLGDDEPLGLTDGDGRLVARISSDRVNLSAWRDEARSTVVRAAAGSNVTLEFPKKVTLTVTVTSPANHRHLVLRHRLGIGECRPEPTCSLQVPVGEFQAVVVGDVGRTAIASFTDVARDRDLTREVQLGPAPPITGVVKDQAGRPLAGLTVRAHGLGRTADEARNPEKPWRDSVGMTNEEGRFSIAPVGSSDLFFSVSLGGPWRLDRGVLVLLGDEPLALTAIPAG
ncbi:MAG: hypothetical protein ACOZQL_38995 [Myxococcota bacterium]